MRTFVLTGPNTGATGLFGRFPFVNGECCFIDDEAPAAARILCRYHGCVVKEENMVIHIWGPQENEWLDRARFIARETWPGCVLEIKTPDDFMPLTSTVARCKGVIVVGGHEGTILEQYRNAGFENDRMRVLPANLSDVPDPNHSEPKARPSTSARVEAIPGAEQAVAPTVDQAKGEVQNADKPAATADEDSTAGPDPEVVARFIRKPINGEQGIRAMLRDPEMSTVFTPAFVSASLDAEKAKAKPRKDVLKKLGSKLIEVSK